MENFENKEDMKVVLGKLKDYLEKGYLLHGSKVKTDVLKPMQAKDDDPNRSHVGNQLAIYAESSDVRIPIIMALRDKKDKSKQGFTSSYSCYEKEGKMHIEGDNLSFTQGFVYVLNRDAFKIIEDKEKQEIELVSYEPVRPVEVLEVKKDILKYIKDIEYKLK